MPSYKVFSTPGTFTTRAPAGATKLNVWQAIGGGGSGSAYNTRSETGGNGGGGGGCGYCQGYSVTSGTVVSVTVGSTAQQSSVNISTTAIAYGNAPSSRGIGGDGYGNPAGSRFGFFLGGNGGDGTGSSRGAGGGGGGGGGAAGYRGGDDGASPTSREEGNGGAGGSGGFSSAGFQGGHGGMGGGKTGGNPAGSSGQAPGGGGGGGGGAYGPYPGAHGQVVLSWQSPSASGLNIGQWFGI